MSFFRVHLTAGLFLLMSTGYTGTVIYQTVNKNTLKHDTSIVVHDKDGSIEYFKFRHLDGNLDGVITKLEADNVDRYRAPRESYDFAKKLNDLDKRLVYGLSFKVAEQAVGELSESEKLALLKIDLPQRVNLINSRFA